MKNSIISKNSKARYEYFIDDCMEAGIALIGSEVKSLRKNKASLNEAYAECVNSEIYVYNIHISPYQISASYNPIRPRKLLLHGKQIRKLIGLTKKKGITLVPTKLYFNSKNIVKVELSIARGKKIRDKRETIKLRDIKRESLREEYNE